MKKNPTPAHFPRSALHPGVGSYSDDMLLEMMSAHEEAVARHQKGAPQGPADLEASVVEAA